MTGPTLPAAPSLLDRALDRVLGFGSEVAQGSGDLVWGLLTFPDAAVGYISGRDAHLGEHRSWEGAGSRFADSWLTQWNPITRTLDTANHAIYGTADILLLHLPNYVFNKQLGWNIPYFHPTPTTVRGMTSDIGAALLIALGVRGARGKDAPPPVEKSKGRLADPQPEAKARDAERSPADAKDAPPPPPVEEGKGQLADSQPEAKTRDAEESPADAVDTTIADPVDIFASRVDDFNERWVGKPITQVHTIEILQHLQDLMGLIHHTPELIHSLMVRFREFFRELLTRPEVTWKDVEAVLPNTKDASWWTDRTQRGLNPLILRWLAKRSESGHVSPRLRGQPAECFHFNGKRHYSGDSRRVDMEIPGSDFLGGDNGLGITEADWVTALNTADTAPPPALIGAAKDVSRRGKSSGANPAALDDAIAAAEARAGTSPWEAPALEREGIFDTRDNRTIRDIEPVDNWGEAQTFEIEIDGIPARVNWRPTWNSHGFYTLIADIETASAETLATVQTAINNALYGKLNGRSYDHLKIDPPQTGGKKLTISTNGGRYHDDGDNFRIPPKDLQNFQGYFLGYLRSLMPSGN